MDEVERSNAQGNSPKSDDKNRKSREQFGVLPQRERGCQERDHHHAEEGDRRKDEVVILRGSPERKIQSAEGHRFQGIGESGIALAPKALAPQQNGETCSHADNDLRRRTDPIVLEGKFQEV